MKIFVCKETVSAEKRVGLTPESAKKLIEIGYEIYIAPNAGEKACFSDKTYEQAGCSIDPDVSKVQIIVKVSPPTLEEISHYPSGVVLVCCLKPYQSADIIQKLSESNVSSFALELVPRITRAQSMDVLSSQSNLAGYRAVIDAAYEYDKSFPMMMTAAGTIAPTKVLVLGAGVAGLQAIATARRLGALVSAFDVRKAAKEQVESLGGRFIEVNFEETGEGVGGYAKEMSESYQKAQSDKLTEVIKDQDIVIATAQIPGKQAPTLITENMVKDMKKGSIIVDFAAETGGNCALSVLGKTTVKHGVKILAHENVPSRIAYDASQLYAKNVLSFIKNLYGDNNNLNLQDEIVKATLITHKGDIVHPRFKNKTEGETV